jgi:perosamine synthetase
MIPYGQHYVDEDDIQAVVDCLRGGVLTQGDYVSQFEQAVADYVGVRYAVAVSNGTAALHLAAIAADIKPQHAVITSPVTFVASANAALYVGARPVFADVNTNVNLSRDTIAAVLAQTPDVRAIIPVHFAGLPCEMDEIKAVADEFGAVVVEDAAHALGARYPDGQMVGCCANSLMTTFSFHPVKAIATGEGGMVTTNDKRIYQRLLSLRNHGINKGSDVFKNVDASLTKGVVNPWYYEMQELGFNYRITDIQCALGLSQLSKLDDFVFRRRCLVKRYDRAFANSSVVQAAQKDGRELSAHHLYPVRIDFDALGIDRATLMHKLKKRQIITQVHYIPVPAQPYYQSLGFDANDYPNALQCYREILSLPLYYKLTDEQQDHVIAVLNESLVS